MTDAAVIIENLSIAYEEHLILQGITTRIFSGQVTGIVGCNGAGKSSLLKTLRGFQRAKSGKVFYFGRDISKLKTSQLAHIAAYMQQNANMEFNYTGEDVVMAGRYPYSKWWQRESTNDKNIVDACMEYTDTKDLADVPLQIMSGGQKQRILLARVLAQMTPIIFMDEPTAGLDIVYQEEIFRFLRELARNGKCILLAVHELSLAARYCDRILLLGEKQLLADGSPQEILTKENLNKAYHADFQITLNAVTGNLEISARPDDDITKRKKALLEVICHQ